MLSDIKISNNIKQSIALDCESRKHEEACGLLYMLNNELQVIPCENKSSNPKKSFLIDEFVIDEIAKKHRIVGYYHSHIEETAEDFSWIDKTMAENVVMISILYIVGSRAIKTYYPCGWVAPLENREYLTGFFDSFTLIKDYYKPKIKINNHFSYYRYLTPLHRLAKEKPNLLKKIVDKYNFLEQKCKSNSALCILAYDGVDSEFAIYEDGYYLTHLPNQLSKKYTEKDLSDFGYKITYYGTIS